VPVSCAEFWYLFSVLISGTTSHHTFALISTDDRRLLCKHDGLSRIKKIKCLLYLRQFWLKKYEQSRKLDWGKEDNMGETMDCKLVIVTSLYSVLSVFEFIPLLFYSHTERTRTFRCSPVPARKYPLFQCDSQIYRLLEQYYFARKKTNTRIQIIEISHLINYT
jgi:hypothetical protein